MPFTVLVPHVLAERPYLSEALLWVALSRFPLAHILETETGRAGKAPAGVADGDPGEV